MAFKTSLWVNIKFPKTQTEVSYMFQFMNSKIKTHSNGLSLLIHLITMKSKDMSDQDIKFIYFVGDSFLHSNLTQIQQNCLK